MIICFSFVNGTSLAPTQQLSLAAFPAYYHSLESLMIATVIAGICYGILAMLCFNCFAVLLRSKPHLYPSSKRVRAFLLVYVVIMFLLSTGALVQQIGLMISTFLQLGIDEVVRAKVGVSPWDFATVPYTMPLIIWGADGLLMWRCMILYQGIPRAGEWLIKVLLVILSLASLGSGISNYVIQGSLFSIIIIILTPIVNFILTSLLAVRILYQQMRLRRLLGSAWSQQSPYTNIAIICIESSALIVVVAVACITTTFLVNLKPWRVFPYFLQPHICVISSLLIVYRVAQGRSLEINTADASGGRISTINFRDNTQSINP
ncbi:hypothetical protein D9613_010920 [Agrocybe pediades]|uniref:Uncharacterized protein n=1 Tax=Agrocybe pediades TaxID=84607 RepID=A0A8H4QL43_9AGAR|nr:hypothetical protein D9613_010920 [Agrocybe pediades]